MELGQAIPEGLAAMPPGPGLGAVLAGIDLTRVCNDDIDEVMLAHSRQLSHHQAHMFAAISEVVHRRPFAGPLEIRRGALPDQYGSDEIRFALAWNRRAAEYEMGLAVTLVSDLPQVQAALCQGRIDRTKARVFAQHLADLPEAQRTAICEAVLPQAPKLTTGQIGERIKRLILELDPAYYERRYRKAIRDRLVVAYLTENGTAVICAEGLPAEEAAAAWERLDALAKAARRDGHPGSLDQIRADLVLGLLDGTLHGLDRAGILRALMARFAGHADGPTAGSEVDKPAADSPAADSATPGSPASGGTGSDSATPDGSTTDTPATDAPEPDAPAPDAPTPDGPAPAGPGTEAPDSDSIARGTSGSDDSGASSGSSGSDSDSDTAQDADSDTAQDAAPDTAQDAAQDAAQDVAPDADSDTARIRTRTRTRTRTILTLTTRGRAAPGRAGPAQALAPQIPGPATRTAAQPPPLSPTPQHRLPLPHHRARTATTPGPGTPPASGPRSASP